MLREAFKTKSGKSREPIPKGGGSQILHGFSQIRGWKKIFVMGGGVKKTKRTGHFLKLPPNLGH